MVHVAVYLQLFKSVAATAIPSTVASQSVFVLGLIDIKLLQKQKSNLKPNRNTRTN